jgi:glycosyltransferase involved in cell wall biosynthesis
MKVSVCIPTYNQGAFIEQSIRSVINQTMLPFEIIVSNDCSTDNTKHVLDNLSKEISILHVLNQPVNLGISANTNAALKTATGDYIVRLDSDDLLMPDYINILSGLLTKFPEAGYAHGAVKEIDINSKFLKNRTLSRSSGFLNADSALKAAVKGYRVAANILMFRKNALQHAGYISSKVNFAEDYYLSAKIAANGYGNVYHSDFLSCYRVWNDTGKVRVKRKKEEIIGLTAVFNEVLEPSFKNKGWDTSVLNSSRENFAKSQADCLGWDVYTKDEKADLKEKILKLSDSKQTKLYLWLYEHNYGKSIGVYKGLIKTMRSLGKKIVLSISKKN